MKFENPEAVDMAEAVQVMKDPEHGPLSTVVWLPFSC